MEDKKKINLNKIFDYLARYASTSGLAILIEVILFYILVSAGNSIYVANAVSSVLGVVLGWTIGGKIIFKKYNIKNSIYIIWFVYQFIAIALYSFIAEQFFKIIGYAIITKMLVLTLSFAVNSFVFKKIISR